MTRFLQGRWRTMRVIEPDLTIDNGDRPDGNGETTLAPTAVEDPEEGGWPASDG